MKEALDLGLLFCYNNRKVKKLINSYREVTIMTLTEDIVNEICFVFKRTFDELFD